jgi:hypothetical protein
VPRCLRSLAAAFLIVAAFAVATAGLASAQPNDTPRAPIAAEQGSPPQSGGARQDEAGWELLHWIPKELTDIVLAIFTILLAVFTFLLWWTTRALVKSSELTAQRQLRAYLQVVKAQVVLRGDPVIQIEVHNSGQTPAYGIAVPSGVELSENPRKTDPALTNEDADARAIVGGGETFSIEISYTKGRLNRHEVQGIEEGRLGIYIWGIINYTDIFETKRFTRFSYVLTGGVPSDGEDPMSLQICEKGNETSESVSGNRKRRK